MTLRNVFIVGCGHMGEHVSALEQVEGARVSALARSPDSAARLRALGIDPVSGDLDRPESLRDLPLAGMHLYYFAPPPPHGERDPRMEAFTAVAAAPNLPRRVVLISTTGVYGDCHGEWVDERRPANPQAQRAQRRHAAEQTLRHWGAVNEVPVVTLRVAGIYGPGKLPEARLRRGEPVLREEESPWSNRIHADDLARACLAAMHRGAAGAVYHATDGHPTTMTDFFNRVADALGLSRPPQISLARARVELSDGMLSYLAESKRLDNRRLREELGVTLRYPDLERGLAACAAPRPQTE
jgi:nucleoside-diphosphate-sugar epimerase